MLELPEILNLGRQMDATVCGRKVVAADRGNSRHKWVFYNKEADFEALPVGKRVGSVRGRGSFVHTELRPGYVLLVGAMGGRLTYHEDETSLPAKRHLTMRFDDGSCLSVAVQGWGFVQLLNQEQARSHKYAGEQTERLDPLGKEFTYAAFKELVAGYEKAATKSVKYFLISEPGLDGVGNGYLQDILFEAGIHPTRKVAEINGAERRKLHGAIVRVLKKATKLGGSAAERDLFGQPGGYHRVLDSKMKGERCPRCSGGPRIERIAFLGGSCYFCPRCQP